MDEFVYRSLHNYFSALEKLGYIRYSNVDRLLLLIFYYKLLYNDFRGNVSKEDYSLIDKALSCLYGTSCLIPYPKYKKMGSLNLGQISELSHRVATLEDTEVVKAVDLDTIEEDAEQ